MAALDIVESEILRRGPYSPFGGPRILGPLLRMTHFRELVGVNGLNMDVMSVEIWKFRDIYEGFM